MPWHVIGYDMPVKNEAISPVAGQKFFIHHQVPSIIPVHTNDIISAFGPINDMPVRAAPAARGMPDFCFQP